MMKLLVIGATGGTGRCVVEHALRAGHEVTAFARTPQKLTYTSARRWRWRLSWESIDLERSRKVRFGRIARNPAPMLVPDRLTVIMTEKIFEAASRTLQIHSLERSLMIEWE
jgi:nucleoside-diphosphate-sugar epimerase